MKKYLSFLLSAVILVSSMQLSNIPVHAEENETWTFEYTGSVEEWTAPYTGKYYINIHGAGSTNSTDINSEGGGQTRGYVNLVKGQKLYVCIGEKGVLNGTRTYNGGGAGGNNTTAGSGATSITFTDRGELYNFEDYRSEILAVAGGSGGQGSVWQTMNTCGGGGVSGMEFDQSAAYTSPAGHGSVAGGQDSGYAFGLGSDFNPVTIVDSWNCVGYSGGGGGGYYGGISGKCGYIPGGGGSGYINRDVLYDAETTTSSHKGNGNASITYIGEVHTNLIIDLNGHGTYDGQTGKISFNGNYGDITEFHNPEANDEYKFVGYKKVYGSVNPDLRTYSHDFENSYLIAQWTAPMTVETEIDLTAYENKGGMNFKVEQLDELNKIMTVRQSKDGINFYNVFQDSQSLEESFMETTYNPKPGVEDIKFPLNTIPVGEVPGEIQTYTIPKDGLYKLEAYGSNSRYENDSINAHNWLTYTLLKSYSYAGGGSATGYAAFDEGETLYVAVGNSGYQHLGGWNGGGNGSPAVSNLGYGGKPREWYYRIGAGGGGATHIATTLIGDGQLKNYDSDRDAVLVCAGGAGGGGATVADRGAGGGEYGYPGGLYSWAYGVLTNEEIEGKLKGGTQEDGYAFGKGQNTVAYQDSRNAGGGGGWYGGYAWTEATSYRPAGREQRTTAGGGSGHIGNVVNGVLRSGVNMGEGYAVISFVQEYIKGNYIANIYTPDIVSPDKPSNGQLIANNDNLTIQFDIPEDNGTKYWHEITSYEKNNDAATGLSDPLQQKIVEDTVLSGIKGYYYIVDTMASTTVTETDTFTENNSVDVQIATYERYLHIAAIDNAGNISETYHFKIPSVAKYVVNHYVQNEDDTYTLVETEEKTGTIGTTVAPEVHTQTGRDNPKTQSIIITADGKAHVDYYYDVTCFDVNGNVSWNDHENLYKTRPDDIGLTIYRDGEYFDYITIPTTDTVNKYQFPTLQKYDLNTGQEFEYTVSQDTAYSKASESNSEDKYQTKQNGFDFLNTIRNVEPVSPDEPNPDNPDDKGLFVEGNIYWDDNADSLGFRPSETTITIYQKGEDGEWKPFREPIVVDAKNDNHYIFDWLPKYWYDENDVPTAYEYKVEETFTSWYVKDGEIKNAYIIHEDQPNNFDFTNEFIPDGPIIPVNEYVNTIIVKTNTDEQVRIILKPLELFIHNDYSVFYDDLTGNDVSVMADKTGTTVSDLPGTRYEVVLDSPEYTLENIELSLSENVELEEIDDKWYVTIKNVSADTIGTLEVKLTKKEQFYQDRQRFMNYFATGTKNLTKELKKYSVMKMSDSIVIYDPEMDKDATISDSSELTDNLTITYMDSDTEDLNTYSVGDKTKILDYLGKIPAECKFIGWSETPDVDEAEYMVNTTVEIKNNMILYPVFNNTEHQSVE